MKKETYLCIKFPLNILKIKQSTNAFAQLTYDGDGIRGE